MTPYAIPRRLLTSGSHDPEPLLSHPTVNNRRRHAFGPVSSLVWKFFTISNQERRAKIIFWGPVRSGDWVTNSLFQQIELTMLVGSDGEAHSFRGGGSNSAAQWRS